MEKLETRSVCEFVSRTSCDIDLLMRLPTKLLLLPQTTALVFCAPPSVERVLVRNKWCHVSRKVGEWNH